MIIGLTGKKGCGKSSVARIIAEQYNYGIKSFATPIKLMLSAMGLSNDELYDPKKKEDIIPEFGKSPRELMQLLGTEFGRTLVSQNIWVTSLEKHLDRSKNYVIDDVRFANEAAMIRAHDGVIVRVVRGLDDSPDEHISEAGINSELINYEIQNISCYETDLQNEVNQVLEEILYYGAIRDSKSKSVAGQ
jgi:energy-coupling factor transporter ATP-binding protein EcfA2